MSDIGYLQGKIREQGEKIKAIENTLKVVELKIRTIKDFDEQREKLTSKLLDLEVFEKRVGREIKTELNTLMGNTLNKLKKQDEGYLEFYIKSVTKKIKIYCDKEMAENNAMITSVVAMLIDKGIVKQGDVNKMYAMSEKIQREGLKKLNDENQKKADRMERRVKKIISKKAMGEK